MSDEQRCERNGLPVSGCAASEYDCAGFGVCAAGPSVVTPPAQDEQPERMAEDHLQHLEGRAKVPNLDRLAAAPSVSTDHTDETLIGIVRAVLAEHWLFDIGCDHEAETNSPVCACCLVNLGTHPTVAGARDAWIAHVMEQIKEAGRG